MIRSKTCPFEKIEQYVPLTGNVLDIGCGLGFFSNLLAIKSNKRNVIGIDIDENKIKNASKTMNSRYNIRFKIGDIRHTSLPQNNHCITILDVLYLIPWEEQICLLKRCFDSLNKGGVLILKDINTSPRWKYWLTVLQEFFAVKVIKVTKGDKFYFRGSKELIGILNDIGFEVNCIDIGRGFLYSHILYVGKKEY